MHALLYNVAGAIAFAVVGVLFEATSFADMIYCAYVLSISRQSEQVTYSELYIHTAAAAVN